MGILSLQVKTEIPVREALPWDAYMGSYYDGIFRKKKKSRYQIKIPELSGVYRKMKRRLQPLKSIL